MEKLFDQIIVIDVEATCWKDKAPDEQVSEIIEIGVCPLEVSSGTRLGKESILIRPEHSTVSEFCTHLTTLTQEQVNGGLSFEEACRLLREKYLTRKRTWASYGEYDRNQFERQCRLFGVEYPFGTRHINVKNLFALMNGLDRERGMAGALTYLGLSQEGTHHLGGDDAWNIARILLELLFRRVGVHPAQDILR
jgi:inhibitor of KinA sporulation pathway (predicted exonuclease)